MYGASLGQMEQHLSAEFFHWLVDTGCGPALMDLHLSSEYEPHQHPIKIAHAIVGWKAVYPNLQSPGVFNLGSLLTPVVARTDMAAITDELLAPQ